MTIKWQWRPAEACPGGSADLVMVICPVFRNHLCQVSSDCHAVLEVSGSTCSGLVLGAGVKWEARNASGVDKGSSLEMINILERKMFLGGEKLVAVISEAASAGISLHADRWLARLQYAKSPSSCACVSA